MDLGSKPILLEGPDLVEYECEMTSQACRRVRCKPTCSRDKRHTNPPPSSYLVVQLFCVNKRECREEKHSTTRTAEHIVPSPRTCIDI